VNFTETDPACVRLRACVSSKIGEDQSAEDAEDGPPELLVSQSSEHTIRLSFAY